MLDKVIHPNYVDLEPTGWFFDNNNDDNDYDEYDEDGELD